MLKYTGLFFLSLCLFATSGQAIIMTELGGGYRQDRFEWKLGGGHGWPSTLSKLTWSDLKIGEINGKAEADFCGYLVKLEGDYGWISSGDQRDADYRFNDNFDVEEYLRSKASASGGHVWDVSLSAGSEYNWLIPYGCLHLFIGATAHEQYLPIHDGRIVIDLDDPNLVGSRIPNLHSSYRANWYGGFLSADYYLPCTDCLAFYTTQQVQSLYYKARGHWNLREDILGDFHHHGWGWAYFGTLGAQYLLPCNWFIDTQVRYNYARVANGWDSTTVILVTEENQPTAVETRGKLTSVIWQSFSFLVNVGWMF